MKEANIRDSELLVRIIGLGFVLYNTYVVLSSRNYKCTRLKQHMQTCIPPHYYQVGLRSRRTTSLSTF